MTSPPKIKVYGKGTLRQIGVWVGLAKKRLAFLRQFRLNYLNAFQDRIFLRGAQITIKAVRNGIDEIVVKVLGETTAPFQLLLTPAYTDTVHPNLGTVMAQSIKNRVLSSFEFNVAEGEDVFAVGLTALASKMTKTISSPVFDDLDYPPTSSVLAETARQKQHGQSAMQLLHTFNVDLVSGVFPVKGGVVIRNSLLPGTWQAESSDDVVLISSTMAALTGAQYASYQPGLYTDRHTFNTPEAAPFFIAGVAQSELPYLWGDANGGHETLEFERVPKGYTFIVNPAPGLTLQSGALPTADLGLGGYFHTGTERDLSGFSVGPTVEGYVMITRKIINGIDHGDGTISGKLFYRFTLVGSGAAVIRFAQDWFAQDLRALIKPSALEDVRDVVDEAYFSDSEEFDHPVGAGTYDRVTTRRRSGGIGADLFSGIYVGFSEHEIITESPRIGLQSFEGGNKQVGLIESREYWDGLYFFGSWFAFDTNLKIWYPSTALGTNQMRINAMSSDAGFQFGIPNTGSYFSTASASTDYTATKPLEVVVDGVLTQYANATLSLDRVFDSEADPTLTDTGGWSVTQELFAPYVLYTTEGLIEATANSLYFNGTLIYSGITNDIANRVRTQITPVRTIASHSDSARRLRQSQLIENIASGIHGGSWGAVLSDLKTEDEVTLFQSPKTVPEAQGPTLGFFSIPGASSVATSITALGVIPPAGCSIFAPKLHENRDGICIASKLGTFDSAYDTYLDDPSEANKLDVESKYTVLLNNFASRELIEFTLRGGNAYVIL